MGTRTKVAHHDAGAQCGPDVDVRDARVDVHADGLAVLDEYLLEQHPRDLARLNIGIWHEVPLWAVRRRPAQAEAFLLCRPRLHEHVARARYLRFNATT